MWLFYGYNSYGNARICTDYDGNTGNYTRWVHSLDECIPLEDISCFFIDGYDYPCFELKDIANQLDDENNRSYRDIMESLTDETEDFINNFVNMRQVVDFSNTENGLQLYMSDGSGYYWER